MGYFAELTVVELNHGPEPGDVWHDTVIYNISDPVFVAWEREYDEPGCLELGLGTLRLYPAMKRGDGVSCIRSVRSSGVYEGGVLRSSDYGDRANYLTHVVFPPLSIAQRLDPFQPSEGEVYVAKHDGLSRLSATFVAHGRVVLDLRVAHDPDGWHKVSSDTMLTQPPLVDLDYRRNAEWLVKWASGRLPIGG